MAHQWGLGSASGNDVYADIYYLTAATKKIHISLYETIDMFIHCPIVWQAVKQLLELPLNLTIVSPAHTPNWDLVSDVVNSCSRIYRSPKQCRNRYENVIIPREEGKVIRT